MTDASAQFPQAEDGDPDDVSLALETGNALWKKGDHREALRWLRKAAEAASELGADMRSVALASVMADLTTAAQNVVPTASLSPPIPATERASARPPAQSVAPQRARPSPRSVTPTPPQAKNSDDSVEPAVELKRKRRATSPSSLIARAPSDVVAPTIRSTEPRPQSIVASLVAAADRARASDDPPGQPAQRAATANLGGAATPEARSVASPQPQPAAAPSPQAASAHRQAFRVAVEPSDDRSFVVRVLGEGEAAPGYAYEALLVPLEAGVQLLRGKK